MAVGTRARPVAAVVIIATVTITLAALAILLKGSPGTSRIESFISEGRVTAWNLRLPKVHKATENTQHYGLDGELGSLEWRSLLPSGGGLLHLGRDNEIFSISMFHQLRCLDVIGHELMSRAKDPTDQPPSALSHHCMNYLRQMILCRADTTLESATSPYGPHIVIQDITHTCNDWSAVYAAAEENHAMYVRNMAASN